MEQRVYEGTLEEHLRRIENKLSSNINEEAFKKIKNLTILNPDKRDGSIFNAYLTNDDEIEFNSETENCLLKLSRIS